MGREREKGFFDVSKFTAALVELVDSLPSEARKGELDSDFARIVEFVTEIRARLAVIPSRESAEQVMQSVKAINEIMALSGKDVVLRSALGLKPPSPPKKSVPLSKDETDRARLDVAELEAKPIDQLRLSLSDKDRYSVRDLIAMARHMGMRSKKGTSREMLEHQIATRISNFKGYQDLGGGMTGTENET
jgi:hypothetical protein